MRFRGGVRRAQCQTARQGLFLAIEGIEGSGKTTLATNLAEQLRKRGYEVIVTQEPGGDPVADSIRKLVLDARNQISDRAELLLFEAARAQHVDMKILPALQRGIIVISDRYADSSLAYQGFARGLEPKTVRWLNDFATQGLQPDLTILLDLPAEKGLAREHGADRMSSEGVSFHEQVRQAYLTLADQEKERFVVIDATLDFNKVLACVTEAVDKLLRRHKCSNETQD